MYIYVTPIEGPNKRGNELDFHQRVIHKTKA